MVKPLQLGGQILLYAAFAAVVGYLSSSPAYVHHDPDKALIKLSFSHAGEHKGECRRLTPEEIAELPPNMRRPMDCPRERVPLVVELEMDDALLYRGTAPPTGLASDGASTVYERFPVVPGDHTLTVRMRDTNRETGFDYTKSTHVDLVPRQNFVIDFQPQQGGFVFR
ncbi:MAG: hypothetical protein GWN84_11395 [Gammaproteobacteria bacterium]|nr:hypothetical protein [Gammaproteobacteria bacterium]NIR83470.1 hypothetical protein [Gammaproteobacteria bacterium]NIR91392.1 hypothetical protein [Gammaproteobacteria bacterium]NIU04632.1 hypothetical protein [Gammaproteobacteria bacterium]NIV51674.1 hypothetical protein [Gammaproteobacteria bacterium]